MTRYWLDKALWTYARDPAFKSSLDTDAIKALAPYELSPDEHAALASGDIRKIFQLGAHPFLCYSYAIARNGGWSFGLMEDYVRTLKGLTPGDIET